MNSVGIAGFDEALSRPLRACLDGFGPVHYSETTGANASDVVHKRENHRDELGGVKKSHDLSTEYSVSWAA